MNAVFATLACFVIYLLGYHLYAKHIARHVFQLNADAVTPAHTMRDGYDYVPAKKYVLFGHHFASIAGLSPMLGPAIAVMWGWVPAMLWVVFGTLFIGAIHDFSALVISVRAKGKSIGSIAESIIGRRAKSLFHAIIFFLIALAMGVFVQIVAQLVSVEFYPEAVFPTFALIGLAAIMGMLFYKVGVPLGRLTAVAFPLTLGTVVLGLVIPRPILTPDTWSGVLLAYAFLASVLPVWLLLQPRDFLNSLLLYLGLASILGGFFIMRPDFVAPALDIHPEGAPPIFPFVFIVIACGAVSGFHALVSSGTTAKQINNEVDAPFIGYGSMIGESLLSLAAILACTTGFASSEAWHEHYASWSVAQGLGQSMTAFINGAGLFVAQLGIPVETARAFVALVAVSFAMTTLDSGTRLLRYNIEEVSDTIGLGALQHRYISSAVAVTAIAFFAFFKIEGQPAGLALWALFGTTNQLMGGLTLLVVTLYLMQNKRNYLYTLLPMVFLLVTTVIAMALNVKTFFQGGQTLLLVIGLGLLLLAISLIIEAIYRFFEFRSSSNNNDQNIENKAVNV